MMKNILGLTILILMIGCGDEPSTTSTDPSELDIDIAISETIPGVVTVVATAKDANEYVFDMGDGSEPVTNTSGELTYIYEQTNFYQIEVKAYGESGRFLRIQRQVAIELNDGSEDDGYSTPLSYEGFDLLWQDEFNGTGLNGTNWTHELGDGCAKGLCGWGNNELQYYQEANSTVADGYLTITAKQEAVGGKSYTSSRIITQDKFEFQYGRIDIRARMPKGKGMWPALWMLGANIDEISWPACGEVDIMEMVGGGEGFDDTTHGTAHWDDGGYASYGESRQLLVGDLSDEFHVYSIIWTSTSIRWFIDDSQYTVIDTTPSGFDEFRSEFFLIFNIAVGGNWPGSPNGSTQFPQKMQVDYVRVFQETN